MTKSGCWLSFTIFSGFLFKICLSQDSTVSLQDGDCFIHQHCGETLPTLSMGEQTLSSYFANDNLIQPRRENCAETLTWKTEVSKVIKTSRMESSLEHKTRNLENSKENLTRNVKNYRKNIVWNAILSQARFLSIPRQETVQITQGTDNSLTTLAMKIIMSSRYNPTWNVSVPQVTSISRTKRESGQNSPGKNYTVSGLQRSKDIFSLDQSLEALLRRIIVDHINGCDLIIVYDEIYKDTRTLDSLLSNPFTKQVLQLVSVEDLSDMIQWDSKNCQGTMLLLSDPDILINFGGINRFLWAYRAKVIIVGLQLHSLEKFLKTVKGMKTEHVIGVVEDPIIHNFKVYMNLLFWGEGMKLLTDWSGNRFTRKTNLFPDKVKDLRNVELKVITFEYRPLSFYEYGPNRTVIERYGRFVPVVKALAEKFNFTINYIDIQNVWGLPLGNGTFNGLVGYLQRDDGHIGLPYLYMSAQEDRHKEQDHGRIIEDDKVCFIIRREAPRPAWQSLGLPFTLQSWIAVISGIILSGPIFCLFVMASTITGEEYKYFRSLTYSSLFTIGIQIDEPLPVMPKRLCNQIFITFLLIYSLLLTTGYRSNLISFLTVARPPKLINSFKDLAESGMQVNALQWLQSSMALSGDPYLRELSNRFEAKFLIEEFMDEFMEGKIAHLNSLATLEVIDILMRTKTGKPLTRLLKNCLTSYSVTLGYQWHSPLNPRFDKVIARLVESGITRQWVLDLNQVYKKLVEKEGGVTFYPDVWHGDEDGLIPLSNSHLTGIWAALAIGYFLATVSFAVEVIRHKGIP